jgi:hypothetical protein
MSIKRGNARLTIFSVGVGEQMNNEEYIIADDAGLAKQIYLANIENKIKVVTLESLIGRSEARDELLKQLKLHVQKLEAVKGSSP